MRMTTAKVLYQRWINELWAGKPIAAELVSQDFVGHWPDREVHGPDELQAVVDETQQMMSELLFVVEIEPVVDRDLVAARWPGSQATTSCGSPTAYSSSTGRVPPPPSVNIY